MRAGVPNRVSGRGPTKSDLIRPGPHVAHAERPTTITIRSMTNPDLISLSALARKTRRSPNTLRQLIDTGLLVPSLVEVDGRHRILFDAAAIEAAGLSSEPEATDRLAGEIDAAVRQIVSEQLSPLVDRLDQLERAVLAALAHSACRCPEPATPQERTALPRIAKLLDRLCRTGRIAALRISPGCDRGE